MQDQELQIQMEVEDTELQIQMDAEETEQSIELQPEDVNIVIGRVDDVLVNGTSVVDDRIAYVNIKTVNNNSLIGDGNINIPVPTKTSDLINDSDFVTNSEMTTAIGDEATARQNADIDLQKQIDAITVSSDVIDVLGTYTELQNYDTSHVKDNDIIKVLQDETHNNAMSYYRWEVVNNSGSWAYIGSEGPFYTKSEIDSDFYTKTATNNLLNNKMNITNPTGSGRFQINGYTTGTNSVCLGTLSSASGAYSYADGYRTRATANYSHAQGFGAIANGEVAHAQGRNTHATGKGSHAEGDGTEAIGTTAHAEGTETIAKSNYSHAEGHGTIASSPHQHVQGKYNIEDSNSVYAHIVGNGGAFKRSNAYTLDWNGNGWYAGSVEAVDGVIIKSPNGTRFKIVASDDGTLSTIAIL